MRNNFEGKDRVSGAEGAGLLHLTLLRVIETNVPRKNHIAAVSHWLANPRLAKKHSIRD